jgi:hypothetical protein
MTPYQELAEHYRAEEPEVLTCLTEGYRFDLGKSIFVQPEYRIEYHAHQHTCDVPWLAINGEGRKPKQGDPFQLLNEELKSIVYYAQFVQEGDVLPMSSDHASLLTSKAMAEAIVAVLPAELLDQAHYLMRNDPRLQLILAHIRKNPEVLAYQEASAHVHQAFPEHPYLRQVRQSLVKQDASSRPQNDQASSTPALARVDQTLVRLFKEGTVNRSKADRSDRTP